MQLLSYDVTRLPDNLTQYVICVEASYKEADALHQKISKLIGSKPDKQFNVPKKEK